MSILTAAQRQQLEDRRALAVTTLALYSGDAFQTTLVEGLADSEEFDAGIEALYNHFDTAIRSYEDERTALDGDFVTNNIDEFYTGELDEVEGIGIIKRRIFRYYIRHYYGSFII